MFRLPVIAGYGGVNAAGRSSCARGYQRMILDVLPADKQQETLLGLASQMRLVEYQNGQWLEEGTPVTPAFIVEKYRAFILENTLIRKISGEAFPGQGIPFHRPVHLNSEKNITFQIKRKDLPETVPSSWEIHDTGNEILEIHLKNPAGVLLAETRPSLVNAAGQLPTGFNPQQWYPARQHPRGLQMTIFGISDALSSCGILWETILNKIKPDEVGVYASSAMSQLDDQGYGGMIKAPYLGTRPTSKQLPFGFAEMPADFINAYVLGNLGATSGILGACASFLYNLEMGVRDIQSGIRRAVIVGTSEAPVLPEILEGFRVMKALAEDKDLLELDKARGRIVPDYPRACRPFGNNCGFVMGESAQFLVLLDDELAMELGAPIYGAVPGVFINADGFKKSISAPGIGNYLCLGKTAGLLRKMLGDTALSQRTYVHAHGTGTPQNRVTESHVLNEIAKAFSIPSWLVTSVKCYTGHSLGTAAGDQMATALGTWNEGWIPGIFTLDQIADDVHRSNLRLEQKHQFAGINGMDAVVINSKGFGGNNASSAVLAPHIVHQMLKKRYGESRFKDYRKHLEQAEQSIADYDQRALQGEITPTYIFGKNVLEGDMLNISREAIHIPGYTHPVSLDIPDPYAEISPKN
ncbi:MAG: beta-ketoacyl synthase [SAR324 cluster bacterium]|nr:beta-ketoacyl synthase [SAR324 cluster bacterium]